MLNDNDRKDIKQTELEPKRIKALLARPDSFGYSGENPEMFKTWTLGPVVVHRDSDVLERANWKALERELERIGEEWEDKWDIVGCNHWAVGWVDHLSYRVIDEKGEPTDIARWIESWFNALEGHPVADESLFSEMEEEERYEYYSHATSTRKAHITTLKHEFELRKPTVRWLKEHWGLVYRLVGDNDSDAIYNDAWGGASDYWTRDRLAKELRDHHRWVYEDKIKKTSFADSAERAAIERLVGGDLDKHID